MLWMPVFASYAMPALLLVALSVLTGTPRWADRRLARVSSQRPKTFRDRQLRRPVGSGHGEEGRRYSGKETVT
jgi:hypothetical protein